MRANVQRVHLPVHRDEPLEICQSGTNAIAKKDKGEFLLRYMSQEVGQPQAAAIAPNSPTGPALVDHAVKARS